MHDPYTQNAFRVLGLAAETEPALLPTWMEPRHLPNLWKVTWLAEPDRSNQAVATAMQALKTPEQLLYHYRTWFRKENALDQRAFKAIEDGYWEGAADLWKSTAEVGDEGALQNLIVLYHSRAISSSHGKTPVWAYWTRALEWCNRMVQQKGDDPASAQLQEHIIEDLVALAHDQASRNSPEDVRLVLDIFRRAGLPQQRREQLEQDLLSLELTRLQHRCNKIREALPGAFRVGDSLSEINVGTFQATLENEIYPMLEWIQKAQPSGPLEDEARKDVAMLLRSLSRAVRGKVDTGDMGFMAKAVSIAPRGFHSELLEGEDAPTEVVSKQAAPEFLEDTFRPEVDVNAPPARRRLNPLVVVLLVVVLVMTAGGGLLLHRHQQQLDTQRRELQQEWNESIDHAADLAAQRAELQKSVEKTRQALENCKPSERKRIQAKLDGLKQEQAKLIQDHQEALNRIVFLKDKLARIK